MPTRRELGAATVAAALGLAPGRATAAEPRPSAPTAPIPPTRTSTLLLAAGGAGLGTAAIFGVIAIALRSRAQRVNRDAIGSTSFMGLDESTERAVTLRRACLGASIAAASVGALGVSVLIAGLVVRGREQRTIVAPVVTRSGGGAALRVAF